MSRKDQQWLQKGVDIWMIRDNLNASYETRVERHQDTLNFIESLKKIGRLNRAKPSKTSTVSRSKEKLNQSKAKKMPE
ncbi:MAG: hypothetical protein HY877_05710 [Deltaproteobacteria bacterium]|nr:hypothetical protein [Deltaproteobacteria bacterium]